MTLQVEESKIVAAPTRVTRRCWTHHLGLKDKAIQTVPRRSREAAEEDIAINSGTYCQ
jgi:hypothetical protein